MIWMLTVVLLKVSCSGEGGCVSLSGGSQLLTLHPSRWIDGNLSLSVCTSCDISAKKKNNETKQMLWRRHTQFLPSACALRIFLAVSPLHDVWGETRRFNFRGQMCQVAILHCNGLYQLRHRKSLRLEWGGVDVWLFLHSVWFPAPRQ